MPEIQRYAGVLARHANRIALIRECYEQWNLPPYWSPPSGAVEPGETPPTGARRELQEESGLHAPTLHLAWTTRVEVDGTLTSRSWNYLTDVDDPTFAINDPDNSVLEARWFTYADAIEALKNMPYPPIAVPAIHYLTNGTQLNWHFTQTNNTWTWTLTAPARADAYDGPAVPPRS
ncbi:NUDIX hydrolase [Kribbella solani]|uniref:NUDIX hydrolase n=1 Tax=Kribbella solani TaxID=236067 RepID=UPI0029BF7169|nr:NUDIX hydrolase [Kribbella solani]MDX2972814.1 NUDIX hydrolase [Kribbella solani]MDX3006767.1 NUDIX hydrolase [Kribbella solani]